MTMLKFNLLPPSQFDGIGHSSAGGLGLGSREGLMSAKFLSHCIMLPAAFSTAGAICKLWGNIPALWQHLAAEKNSIKSYTAINVFWDVRNETCCPVLIPTAASPDVPHRVGSANLGMDRRWRFGASTHPITARAWRVWGDAAYKYCKRRPFGKWHANGAQDLNGILYKSPPHSGNQVAQELSCPRLSYCIVSRDILPIPRLQAQISISMIQIPHILCGTMPNPGRSKCGPYAWLICRGGERSARGTGCRHPQGTNAGCAQRQGWLIHGLHISSNYLQLNHVFLSSHAPGIGSLPNRSPASKHAPHQNTLERVALTTTKCAIFTPKHFVSTR
jgi:hypothetical protein